MQIGSSATVGRTKNAFLRRLSFWKFEEEKEKQDAKEAELAKSPKASTLKRMRFTSEPSSGKESAMSASSKDLMSPAAAEDKKMDKSGRSTVKLVKMFSMESMNDSKKSKVLKTSKTSDGSFRFYLVDPSKADDAAAIPDFAIPALRSKRSGSVALKQIFPDQVESATTTEVDEDVDVEKGKSEEGDLTDDISDDDELSKTGALDLGHLEDDDPPISRTPERHHSTGSGTVRKKKILVRVSSTASITDLETGAQSAKSELDNSGKFAASFTSASPTISSGEATGPLEIDLAIDAALLEKKKADKKFKQDKALDEILDTEISYVANLKIFVEEFVFPIRSDPKAVGLTAAEAKSLFGNVDLLLTLHERLLNHLITATSDSGDLKAVKFNVVVALRRNADFLKMYGPYCDNYETAIGVLDSHLRKNPLFKDFVVKKRAITALAGQEIGSFMISPVQRLPRYGLLLKEVLKHTTDNDELMECERALEKVQSIAGSVNATTETTKLRALSKLVTALHEHPELELLAPHRRLVKEGECVQLVIKKGIKDSKKYRKRKFELRKPRRLFLFSDRLLWINGNWEFRGKLEFSKTVAVYDYDNEEPSKADDSEGTKSGKDVEGDASKERKKPIRPKFAFEVKTEEEYFIFSFRTEVEKKDWVTLILESLESM